MSAKLEGLTEVRGALAALGPAVQDACREKIAKAAEGIRAGAIARAPVEEGDLKGSIYKEISAAGMNAEIGSRGTDYAVFVEFGTADTRAQPFLFPAFMENVRPLRRELRGILKEVGQKLRTRVKRHAKTR